MTALHSHSSLSRRAILAGTVASATALTALGTAASATSAVASSHPNHGRPDRHLLAGDPLGGSKFEGIATDERRGLFYVTETTGGEIHRGRSDREQAQLWIPGHGHHGRTTARGLAVDDRGRLYVAGGPNGVDDPSRPDLWVYSPDGRLLAALRAPGTNVFLNDVVIGPDGAAYFTDSNTPRVFKVSHRRSRWQVDAWVDASSVIAQQTGFNLGGIVVSPDRAALVVAQGNTGRLWRFGLRDRQVTEVSIDALPGVSTDLVNADGLVLDARTLVVVRNFSRTLATAHLSRDARTATVTTQRATAADRVFTTAAVLRGRLLLVDSRFDEATPLPPYEVVVTSMPRGGR